MQIHELPAGTLANADVVAVDNGTSTRKLTFKTVVNSLITIAMTPTAGTLATSSACTLNSPTRLAKAGNLVVFNIDATANADISTGSAGAGFITFPAGFRPVSSTQILGTNASTSSVFGLYITASGSCQINIASIASGNIFRVSGSFWIS